MQLDLRQRLERLPPGHPSSPYEADGSRKPDTGPASPADGAVDSAPPRPAPADSRQPPEPFTDIQWAERVNEVRDRLRQAHADGLATHGRHTVDSRGEVWSKERRALHSVIIEEMYRRAADVPNDYQAVIAGGLPGAGKTTVLEHKAGIDRSRFLTINPDDVKAEMARRGMIPEVDGLSPMEASDLAHEESSYIAKRLAFRAQAEGKNIIWDVTMSSLASAQRRIQDLRNNGYTHVEGIFVDLPPEVSARRADNRHRADEEKYRAGTGEGGRFIPAEGILARSDHKWGSLNRRIFEAIKHDLDAWLVYDNSVDGRPPVLVDASGARERNS